jgi:hypothetical protein
LRGLILRIPQNSENQKEYIVPYMIPNAVLLSENSRVRHVQAFLSNEIHTIERILAAQIIEPEVQRIKRKTPRGIFQQYLY